MNAAPKEGWSLGWFLREEMRSYPGRINLALRCVLASALVIVISMALQVPLLALSLLVVFYVTQSNVVLTRLVGMMFLVGITVAIVGAIAMLKLTHDFPLMRILVACALFFASVFLMRVIRIGIVFFITGIAIIYVQTFVDVTDDFELLVRAVLWVWVAASYATALTLLVNTLFLPAEPARQLEAELRRQLRAVADQLAFQAGTRAAPTRLSAHDVQRAMLALRKLLRFASMRDRSGGSDSRRYLACVGAVSRMLGAARQLQDSQPGSAPRAALMALHRACLDLDQSIAADTPFAPKPPVDEIPRDGLPGAALEIRRCLRALTRPPLTRDDTGTPAGSPGGLLVPDAFENPVYVQFALKTLLATMLAYVFYTAVDWQGIHTMMLSCLIVAQPSLGASRHKGLLRIGGAVVGSVLALTMMVLVVPRIVGITGLLLMTLPVILLGAWVAAGSERIGYAGIQIVFTFALALLEQFGPVTELTEIRDRMIGILLGVLLSIFIHATLWPEAEGEALRQRIAGALREIAALLRAGGAPPAATEGTTPYSRAWSGLAEGQAMMARVALEPGWQLAEGEHEALTSRMQAVLAQAREVLLATDALQLELRALPTALDTAAGASAKAWQEAAAAAIEHYAGELAGHSLQVDPPAPVSLDDLEHDCERAAAVEAHRVQAQRLLALARKLQARISGLPGWNADASIAMPSLQELPS